MGKRKREDDDDDYVNFCSGLQQTSRDGVGNNSYVYSCSRPFKRPKINPNIYKRTRVDYRYVQPHESVFKEIERKITNNSIVIDDIIEVNNPTLEVAYTVKMLQKIRLFGDRVHEELLFHGTRERNVHSICTFNFDWRLNGFNKGHKFGKGVCFSRNAKYASNYSDRQNYQKVMIVAKVLISEVCSGSNDMSIPPQGYDTSQKGRDGVVLVKYEDNEFIPAYILYYHFRDRYEERGYFYDNRQYYDKRGGNYGRDNYRYGGRDRHSRKYNRQSRYNEHFYNSQDCSDNSPDFSCDDHQYDNCNYYAFN